MDTIVRELIAISKEIVSSVKIKDDGDTVIVVGRYDDIKEFIPKLKSWKFRWDPGNKNWWIDSEKFGPQKRKLFESLINQEKAEASEEDRLQHLQSIMDLVSKMPKGTPYLTSKVLGTTLLVFGKTTYDNKTELSRNGGRWDAKNRAYAYDLFQIDKKNIDNLSNLIQSVSKSFEKYEQRKTTSPNSPTPSGRLASPAQIKFLNNLLYKVSRVQMFDSVSGRGSAKSERIENEIVDKGGVGSLSSKDASSYINYLKDLIDDEM